MSSSIGAFTFIKMTGPKIPQLAIRVETISREGLDGDAFRLNAQKVPEITVQTIAAAVTLAAANLAPDTYAALIGTQITVVDDLGRTVTGVMVLDVKVTAVRQLMSAVPTCAAIVYAVWVLKPTT